MARKFYVSYNGELTSNQTVVLSGDEYNHIVNVSRKKVDEQIVLVDGKGNDIIAQIVSIGKKDVTIKIIDIVKSQVECDNNVVVFQALVKGDKFELITQKLTEIGVKKIVPFCSEFCQVKPNTTRLDRLEKIGVEALKQCGGAKKIEIENIRTFEQMLDEVKKCDLVLFAYENSTDNLSQQLFAGLENKPLSVGLIVGSEGGFSQAEVQKLISLKNVKIISMGKRILRAETACIALASVTMFLLDEWKV